MQGIEILSCNPEDIEINSEYKQYSQKLEMRKYSS